MNFTKVSFRKYIIVFFIPALLLTGCGVWEDFTTYFNLYYNTVDKFDEAEKLINEQKRELFSIEEVPLPGSVNQLLTSVIERASKILQFHESSSFVDEALLMLGKSFYYQKNYQKALRKFQELIATQPESDLILETQLWIGKSEMQMKESEAGLASLRDVRKNALEEGEAEILEDAFVEEIKYHIATENYSSAITVLKEFISVSDNDIINAEATYELGILYTEINDLENAVASYEEVFNYSPEFEIEIRSNIELAKSLRALKRPAEALELFEDIGAQGKYKDAYAEIDYETGKTLVDLERFDEAVDLLIYTDTSYATTKFSGMARYELGEIFEYHFLNYDSAYNYYQKSVGGQIGPEMIVAANNKVTRLKKYQNLRAGLLENQKSLSYLQDSTLFIKDSIAYSDELKVLEDELAIKQLNEESRNGGTLPETEEQSGTSRSPSDSRAPQRLQQTTSLPNKKPPVYPVISSDSIKSLIIKNEFELANLFYTEFNLIDSAYKYYSDIVQNYPESNYYGRALYGVGSYFESKGDTVTSDSVYNIVYEKFKDDRIVNAVAVKINKPVVDLDYDPAKKLYEDAEQLMLKSEFSESLDKFYNIYLEHPNSSYAPKALFATGWILENELKLYDSAAVVYDSIASVYPRTIFASTIKPKLDTYKFDREAKRKARQDSLKAIKMQQDSIAALSDTLAMDTDSLLQADSVKTNVDIPIQNEIKRPPGKQVDTDTKKITSPQDSLKLQHQMQVDSLLRAPGVKIDSVQQKLEEQVDSLNPGKTNNGILEE